MSLKERLMKAWENRSQIAEGFYNAYISHDIEIRQEAERRLEICKANSCGYWDETGTNERLAVNGQPGCTGCGCNGKMKTSCMSCYCYLQDIKQRPLWEAVITNDMDKNINEVEYTNQFKPKQ